MDVVNDSIEAVDKFYIDNPSYAAYQLVGFVINEPGGQRSWNIVNDDDGQIVGCVYPDGSTFAF